MSRRRLRLLTYSSSDEDDTPRQQHDSTLNTESTVQEPSPEVTMAEEALASTTLNPNPNYDFPSPPMEISDDEIGVDEVFVEASDNLSPPSPVDSFRPPQSSQPVEAFRPSASVGDAVPELIQDDVMEEGDVCLIKQVLSRLGLRLKSEWVALCVRGLERSVSGFGNLSVDRKAELCFGQFLLSDMNCAGGGVLPENVGDMHLVDLSGPFVLQVDEIVNISCPLRQRYHKAAPGNKRCLKLSMTDGIQRVFGMEYRPIKDLDVLAPAGLKVAIRNVHVRHGLLMLVPEAIEILGGRVEELEAGHQRLIAEINKPPRGRRPRMGNILPLATRATNAAWPSTVTSGHEQAINSRSQISDSVQAPVGSSDSGMACRMRGADDSRNPNFHDARATGREQHHHSRAIDLPPLPTRATPNTCPTTGASDSVPDGPDRTHQFTPLRSRALNTTAGCAQRFDQDLHLGTQPSDVEMTNAGVHRDRSAGSYFSNEDNRETTDFDRPSNTFNYVEDIDMTDDAVETIMSTRSTAEMDQYSNHIGNTEDSTGHDEGNHLQMLNTNQEIPFTYLTFLSAKLLEAADSNPTVKGKIKCFLTGVKSFQYQGRKTYELRAYVEDGSLISEILIDHSVVQDRVGYSPVEVNAAISSTDGNIVSRMKEIMKQFQSFLVNFEGTMTVELKKSSPTPVAIEMTQGCPTSNSWLLLRRVKNYATVHNPQSSEPIVLSP